jgi:phage head maturation protease
LILHPSEKGNEPMRLYGDIQKVDVEQRMVWGYASTEALDAHGETVTKTAIEEALAAYLEYANVREMHQLSAVGLTKEASVDDKGLYVGVHVVDDTAWGKVTSGLYKGFSIGGKTLERDSKNRKIITKILLNEISLVDRPSNPEARFDVWKAARSSTLDQVFSAMSGEERALILIKAGRVIGGRQHGSF